MPNVRKINSGKRLVVGVTVFLLSGAFNLEPLYAVTGCIARPSGHDDRFGLIPLGTKIKDISKDAQLKPCASGSQCIFTDAAGILYESKDGVVISSKGFDFPSRTKGDFPLGLSRENTIADFMSKVVPEDDAYASILKNGPDKIIILSGPCYANTTGVVFQVMATFSGDGYLSGVGIVDAADVTEALEFRDQLLKPK